MKWYKQPDVDNSVIISSRVRLARNLASYPFPSKLPAYDAAAALEDMKAAALKIPEFTFADLSHVPTSQLNQLAECHVISPAMANKSTAKGLIYNEDENISIMLNEEDHLRIQAIFPQQNLDAAYEAVGRLDDALSESLEYAFDTEFGFLTSCPTNTGTGMRASYMLHVPLLESTGNLKIYADLITKAGFAIRGTHGEGSESMGGIYQISNQMTLGKGEEETISSLKHLANQLVEKELSVQQHVLKEFLHETEDAIFRAYGALTHCRKISITEAMKHLSDIRLGRILGLIKCEIKGGSVYNLMTNILPNNLQRIMGLAQDLRHLEVLRADYLRDAIT